MISRHFGWLVQPQNRSPVSVPVAALLLSMLVWHSGKDGMMDFKLCGPIGGGDATAT